MRLREGACELRIACKRKDLLPSLREYDPYRETWKIECGMPVKRFYRGTEKNEEGGFLTQPEDDVWVWRILLTADVSAAEVSVEMFRKQDMVLIYRTSTDEQLVECVRPLFPRLHKGEAACGPTLFCFANVDAAKEFIRFIGWQTLADGQIIDIDYDDVIKSFASQQGNILCISKKSLLPEEALSEKEAEVQVALLIFRGDDLSLYDVCVEAEKICSSFHKSAEIIWIMVECQEQSVTALLAKRLTD